MFEFIKKTLMNEQIPSESIDRIIRELSVVIEKATKKSFKEFKVKAILLSKRLDALELEFKKFTTPLDLRAEKKPAKRKYTKRMATKPKKAE